ncbi:bifunctional hydroxymethylpyrimidine kinase/phosphomethylpyrimidine kinase [Pseudarthrobacter sp. J75]|uniref:bifunctional hydroxymethylpyrimidine kinase/phosphomethylpyrimidine kinase n=1 Tax=unclassified Pseudarthrobacter TaxID=2647000 RepID=UPI002E80FA94|nr:MULTISPECIES: bifunctional hydroxymethylpyrimidine kinase/phosphomethylpyrimidine kinase [unclassified Pseudarthrobacter]MEE2522974.1 bifunctional hydroxymethylpyrimidine kinase/phosphomethylpyrimidine kinase [Pseudarthrobacter sp. J47]MEE2529432.1 bifunctional hydroxymethylpyrimidine kinase/phosphomethylpyrimidine kinase [Pseudarthrobacter sp. J75]
MTSSSVLPVPSTTPAAPFDAGAASPAAAVAAEAVRRTTPRVLSIAGSDPSGGAGIQADLKSIAAHGGYGMAAITALTAQNTLGVQDIHVPPASFLARQLEAISDDITIDALKIGMLGDGEVIAVVGEWLRTVRPAVVVLDPVMVATSGDRLLKEQAEAALVGLLPLADLVTPNLAELAILLGEEPAADWPAALEQGKRLSTLSGATVLVKGGHLDGDACPDALVNTSGLLSAEVVEFMGPRIATTNSHGTGCSLSSAMATVKARLGSWEEALAVAKPWLEGALAGGGSLGVGQGKGPVHHFHHLVPAGPDGSANDMPGDFSDLLWREAGPYLDGIYALDFIRDLGSGDLTEEHFAYYLGQDSLYLNGYSRVLARASALAPTEDEQRFWARSAVSCLEVESELHRTWLAGRAPVTAQGPVTKSYVDHLLASSAGGSYAVLVAAVLPCFWLYAEVGEQLYSRFVAEGSPAGHPYAEWLRTYADEAFAEATRQAIAIADTAGRTGSEGERTAMLEAFTQSCQFEVDFFDAPRRFA